MKNLITASLVVVLGTAALGEPVPQAESKRYGVIFKVTTDGVNRISDLKVDRVMDPSGSGSEQEKAEHPVNIIVSPAYLASAKRFLEETIRQKGLNTLPSTYYTYTLLDPSQPDRAEIDEE